MRKEDDIIGALIGLVGACGNNPKTNVTDSLVIKALALPVLCKEPNEETLKVMIDAIHTEKNMIAPDCARCVCPCGNTSDYDMRAIREAEPKIRDIKLKLLSECQQLAASICQRKMSGEKAQMDNMRFYVQPLAEEMHLSYSIEILYEILSRIRYDIREEELPGLLDKVYIVRKKMEGIYDKEDYKD